MIKVARFLEDKTKLGILMLIIHLTAIAVGVIGSLV